MRLRVLLAALLLAGCISAPVAEPEGEASSSAGASSSSESAAPAVEWFEFENDAFSFRYPAWAVGREGSCEWLAAPMHLLTFEDPESDDVYLSQEFLTRNIKNPALCSVEPASLEALKTYSGGSSYWRFRAMPVPDEEAFRAAIREFFGPEAVPALGPSPQEGVHAVTMEGSCPVFGDFPGCPILSSFAIRYRPGKTLLIWQMEGDPKFWKDDRATAAYDEEIRDSVRLK